MNLDTAARHDSVSNDCATLMGTALVVRQPKRQNYLFNVRRSNLTSKSPKLSTPVWVNGKTCSSSRSQGRSPIGGWIELAFLCLRLVHLDLFFLNAILDPMIQYACWSMFLTYSVPSLKLSRRALSNRSCKIGLLAVNKIGCFALWSRFECFSRPFTIIAPTSSIKDYILAMFNVLEVSLLFTIEFETFGKFPIGTNWNSHCSMWWIFSFQRSHLLCPEYHAVSNEVSNSVEAIVSSPIDSWSSFLSVARVLLACSASNSFFWLRDFGLFTSSVRSHSGPFNHPDSLRLWMDVPLAAISAGFSMRSTCLLWSIDESSSISAVPFRTNIWWLLSNNLAGPISVQASLWNVILPPPAIDMASSALQLAGIRFCCEESVSPLTARYGFDLRHVFQRCCDHYPHQVDSLLCLWNPLLLVLSDFLRIFVEMFLLLWHSHQSGGEVAVSTKCFSFLHNVF